MGQVIAARFLKTDVSVSANPESRSVFNVKDNDSFIVQCFLSKINTDKIPILRQVSDQGMLVEKLKRLLLIRSVLDQLPNGLEPITAIGVGCLAGLFDFLAGMFVAQVQQAVKNPDRLHAPIGNQSQCPGLGFWSNNRGFLQ